MPYGKKKESKKATFAERFRAGFNKSSKKEESKRSQELYLKRLQKKRGK